MGVEEVTGIFHPKHPVGWKISPAMSPHPPSRAQVERGDGHGGNGEKRMVENGSRIFHPALAFGWKISPALKFHNFLSGGPSYNFARAISNDLDITTPLTRRASRAGFGNPCQKGMVEKGSRIFHPKLAFGWKISHALTPPGKFHDYLSGGPSCNFERAVSTNGLAFNTTLTLRATKAGF